MNIIERKLYELYLNPYRNGFGFMSALNKNRKTIFSIIMMIFFILSATNSILNESKLASLQRQITEKEAIIHHKTDAYQLFIRQKQERNEKDHNLIYINETVQSLAKHLNLDIQNLQWQLEQGKSIEITLIGESGRIFKFIEELNRLPYLKFNTLILTKTERQLELNTLLVLSGSKE